MLMSQDLKENEEIPSVMKTLVSTKENQVVLKGKDLSQKLLMEKEEKGHRALRKKVVLTERKEVLSRPNLHVLTEKEVKDLKVKKDHHASRKKAVLTGRKEVLSRLNLHVLTKKEVKDLKVKNDHHASRKKVVLTERK